MITYVFKVFFQSSVSLQDEQAQIAQIELAAKKELESKKGKKKPNWAWRSMQSEAEEDCDSGHLC